MTKLTVDLVGWLGAGLLLLAYGLVSFKKLRVDAGYYQLLNIVGSCFLIVNTVYYRAYPSALVNLIWIIIALVAMFHMKSRAASA